MFSEIGLTRVKSSRWLNEDLVLKQQVLNLEHDLSNGYLLGEILHVYNHQQNFHLFQARVAAAICIFKYCYRWGSI